jgi:DNA-binding NtrC family response regulator
MYKKVGPVTQCSSRKILVADEDSMSRNAMSKIINSYLGCEINIAGNETEAFSFLKSNNFDLAIVGISAPEISSVEFIRKTKAIVPNLPLIVVTGDSPESELDILKGMGITRIIYKPFGISPFLEIVAGALIDKERALNIA